MANTTGIVIRALGDGRAEVAADKQGGCGSCSAAHSCHTSKSAKKMTTRVINPVGADPGDIVVIDVSAGQLLKGMAVIYLLPVFGLLSGAVIGANVTEMVSMSETGSALLFGGIGLGIGLGLVVTLSKLLAANEAYTPVISRIVRKGTVEPLVGGPAENVPENCPCTSP